MESGSICCTFRLASRREAGATVNDAANNFTADGMSDHVAASNSSTVNPATDGAFHTVKTANTNTNTSRTVDPATDGQSINSKIKVRLC
jgi:hypothetical protein